MQSSRAPGSSTRPTPSRRIRSTGCWISFSDLNRYARTMDREHSPRTRWRRTSSIIARRVAGEPVLVPLAKRAEDPELKSVRLYVFNETADYLWSLLESPRTAEELARNLTLEFETTAGRAHA